MKKIIIVIFIFNLVSCKSQEKKTENLTVKNNIMENFDINKYKNLVIDEKYSQSNSDFYYKENDRRIRILYDKETIQVEETNISTPYKEVKVYLKKNNALFAKGNDFYSFQIGIDIEYDETGNIIKEINHDLPFKLSVEDLAKQMKEKYNMDIMNVQKTFLVNRFVDTKNKKIPIYEIYYRDEIKPFVLNCYVINGTTGEVLFTAIRYDSEEKQGSSYQNYLDSLKK